MLHSKDWPNERPKHACPEVKYDLRNEGVRECLRGKLAQSCELLKRRRNSESLQSLTIVLAAHLQDIFRGSKLISTDDEPSQVDGSSTVSKTSMSFEGNLAQSDVEPAESPAVQKAADRAADMSSEGNLAQSDVEPAESEAVQRAADKAAGGAEDAKNKAKEGAEDAKSKAKEGLEKGERAVKEGAEKGEEVAKGGFAKLKEVAGGVVEAVRDLDDPEKLAKKIPEPVKVSKTFGYAETGRDFRGPQIGLQLVLTLLYFSVEDFQKAASNPFLPCSTFQSKFPKSSRFGELVAFRTLQRLCRLLGSHKYDASEWVVTDDFKRRFFLEFQTNMCKTLTTLASSGL